MLFFFFPPSLSPVWPMPRSYRTPWSKDNAQTVTWPPSAVGKSTLNYSNAFSWILVQLTTLLMANNTYLNGVTYPPFVTPTRHTAPRTPSAAEVRVWLDVIIKQITHSSALLPALYCKSVAPQWYSPKGLWEKSEGKWWKVTSTCLQETLWVTFMLLLPRQHHVSEEGVVLFSLLYI